MKRIALVILSILLGLCLLAHPASAVRDGVWKFPVNPDGSEARLFDLSQDPGETKNMLDGHPLRVLILQSQLGNGACCRGKNCSEAGREFSGK